MSERKIAFFGGTFDPVHVGHTTVAAAAGGRIGAEKVVFVPAKRSPLKSFLPEAGDEDRLEMIKLAIEGNNTLDVSDYELKGPGPNYTLETVRRFQREFGEGVALYWLIGADALKDLPHWYGVIDLIDECNLSVMHRGGFGPPDFARFEPIWGRQRVEKLRRNVIETPLIEVSSTEIRRRLAAGEDVGEMLLPEVLRYIREHGLYGSGRG